VIIAPAISLAPAAALATPAPGMTSVQEATAAAVVVVVVAAVVAVTETLLQTVH
jgi:hypothetical protein